MNRVLALTVWLGLVAVAMAGCTAMPTRESYQDFSKELVYIPDAAKPAEPATSETAAEAAAGAVAPSTLNEYLAYAALHSPELEAAFNTWKAAVEREPQARALPDPRLMYRYYIQTIETRVGPQRNAYELSQTFPWLGKLELKGDIAAEEARAARHRFDAARLRLFYQVQKAYDEYYYLRRSIRITEDNIELLKQVENVARTRYAVGTAGHPDVIRAQVEQGKLADRLRTLEKLRDPIVAKLNAAMNRPPKAALPWPETIPQTEADFADEDLIAWAAEANPEVQAVDREIAARQKGVELAQKDYLPDVTVGVNYIDTGTAKMAGMSDSGQDAVIAMVSLNLPIWWDKLSAGVREARWRELGMIGRKAAVLNNLSADVESALFGFQDAGRKAGLYRDTLVPKAEEALKSTQAAYSNGKAAFQDYLDAQRILLEFELSYERALTDRAQKMAELEMLVGKPLAARP